MPTFFYTAKSFDGKTETGTINASSESEVAKILKGQGLVLVRAALEAKKDKKNMNVTLDFLGVSAVEKIMMVRNMGVMFSTGLSLVKSFTILSLQAKNKKLKSALLDIKERISKGESLSVCLASHPKIFSDLFVNMVKVGEESGTMDEILQVLSLQLSKEHELKSKVRNAMIYPCIILMVMFVIGGIIITFVLPSLNVFFTALSVDIPIHTKILLFLGNFLSIHWYLLFIVPGMLAFLFWSLLKTKQGRKAFDDILLRTPLISSIVKKNHSAFFIRSLSSLIGAGVPLVRGLEIVSNTLSNYHFKEALIKATESIKKGEKLSRALQPYANLFPLGVLAMVEVGEETGRTADILKKLADFYEQEAVTAIEKLMVLLEPMLIIILGLGVAAFAISIIQPIYSSLQLVNQ